MTAVAAESHCETGNTFVPPIQGLRGVAAMSVLMDHFYDMPKGGSYDLPDPGSAANLDVAAICHQHWRVWG